MHRGASAYPVISAVRTLGSTGGGAGAAEHTVRLGRLETPTAARCGLTVRSAMRHFDLIEEAALVTLLEILFRVPGLQCKPFGEGRGLRGVAQIGSRHSVGAVGAGAR